MIARHDGPRRAGVRSDSGRAGARSAPARGEGRPAHAEAVEIVEPSPDRRVRPWRSAVWRLSLQLHRIPASARDQESGDRRRLHCASGASTCRRPVACCGIARGRLPDAARLHVRGTRLGFFRESTHDLCDARGTGQLLPATLDALDRLMAAVRSIGADAVREVELSENVAASERVVHLDTSESIDARLVHSSCRWRD